MQSRLNEFTLAQLRIASLEIMSRERDAPEMFQMLVDVLLCGYTLKYMQVTNYLKCVYKAAFAISVTWIPILFGKCRVFWSEFPKYVFYKVFNVVR